MNAVGEDRLLALEELTAHQAKTIEELSGEIARQGERMQLLEKTLKAMAKRLVELEEESAPDIPVTRPPHW